MVRGDGKMQDRIVEVIGASVEMSFLMLRAVLDQRRRKMVV